MLQLTKPQKMITTSEDPLSFREDFFCIFKKKSISLDFLRSRTLLFLIHTRCLHHWYFEQLEAVFSRWAETRLPVKANVALRVAGCINKRVFARKMCNVEHKCHLMQNFAVTCTDLTGFDVADSHADHPGKKTEMFIREELQHA